MKRGMGETEKVSPEGQAYGAGRWESEKKRLMQMQNKKSIRLPEYQMEKVSYQKARLNLKSDF